MFQNLPNELINDIGIFLSLEDFLIFSLVSNQISSALKQRKTELLEDFFLHNFLPTKIKNPKTKRFVSIHFFQQDRKLKLKVDYPSIILISLFKHLFLEEKMDYSVSKDKILLFFCREWRLFYGNE